MSNVRNSLNGRQTAAGMAIAQWRETLQAMTLFIYSSAGDTFGISCPDRGRGLPPWLPPYCNNLRGTNVSVVHVARYVKVCDGVFFFLLFPLRRLQLPA